MPDTHIAPPESLRSALARQRPAAAKVAVFALLFVTALTACGTPGGGAGEGPASDADRPGLAVLVVIDQLRPDLIDRYADLWSGGFRRLAEEGFRFTDASHDHAVTETAVGHATLATGVHPRTHGIVANTWWELRGEDAERPWVSVYAVADPDEPVVGAPDAPGRSPESLRAPGLGEWITAADPDARVVSVSKKDRAAITMAGRVRDAYVYWIDYRTGAFVSSRWYREALPDWVREVNEREMPGVFADTVWTSGLPDAWAGRTRPDTFPMEGDRTHTAFPHRALLETGGDPRRFNVWVAETTPATDRAVLSLGLRAIDALRLGRRGATTDYLALSFSAVDYVGHRFGPLSREQLDNLRRLDDVLDRLFRALDERVGRGRWVLALSADHGVATLPEWTVEQGGVAHRATREEQRALAQAIRAADTPEEAAAVAEGFSEVAEAYTHDELRALAGGAAEIDMAAPFRRFYRNGWFEGRFPGGQARWGVQLRFHEHVLEGRPQGGTTHGTPYAFDREVPLVFLGAGVPAGRSPDEAFTVDVAPTLADLAGIATTDPADGRILDLDRIARKP